MNGGYTEEKMRPGESRWVATFKRQFRGEKFVKGRTICQGITQPYLDSTKPRPILERIFFVSNGILSPLGEITVLSPCKAVWFISSVKMGWTIQNHTYRLVTTTIIFTTKYHWVLASCTSSWVPHPFFVWRFWEVSLGRDALVTQNHCKRSFIANQFLGAISDNSLS